MQSSIRGILRAKKHSLHFSFEIGVYCFSHVKNSAIIRDLNLSVNAVCVCVCACVCARMRESESEIEQERTKKTDIAK